MTAIPRIPPTLAERLKTNPFRRPNAYTEWSGHKLLDRTFCKRCGLTLTAIGPDPRFPPINHELAHTKVRTIIQTVMVARLRTPEFDTIEFEVEEPLEPFIPEGNETQDTIEPRLGVHRTAICRACKKVLLDGVNDLAEVQHLYEADLENMALADEASGTSAADTNATIGRLATRRVTRVLTV